MDNLPKTYLQRNKQKEFFKNSLKEKSIYLINSPSGSGKTTFFLNFLEENNLPFTYIPLTQNDVEPINLFKKIKNITKLDLPTLTLDLLVSLESFSKNFFNILFSKTKRSFFVFDDLHNIKQTQIEKYVLPNIIQSRLENNKIIFLSKEELEIPYFDWEIEKKILRLDTNFFKLSDEEIRQLYIQKYNKNLTEEELATIKENTNSLIGRVVFIKNGSSPSICDNLEQGLLSLINRKQLKMLLSVYLIPYINEKTCQNLEILRILEKLYIENFLVEKNSYGYKLHDILREFLSMKAQEIHKNYKEQIVKQAKLLNNLGSIDDALNILMQIEEKDIFANILLSNILDYIYQGKLYSLQRYIKHIENTKQENHPLVLFAKGYLLKFQQPTLAIKYFKEALELFQKLQNKDGEKLVIGELFDLAQFYGEDFKVGGVYLEKAEQLIGDITNLSQIDIRLISYIGIIYLLYKGNTEKSYQYFKLLNQIIDYDKNSFNIFFGYIKLYSAITYISAGKIDEADEVFKQANFIYEKSTKNPDEIFMFNFLASMYELFTGKFEASIKRIKYLLPITEKWGLIQHQEHLITRIIEANLYLGKTKETDEYFNQIENLPYRTSFSKAITYQLLAQKYLIEENFKLAKQMAEKSIELFVKINGKIFEMPTKSLLAVIYTKLGMYEIAEDILTSIIKWSKSTGSLMQYFTSLIHLAYLYLHSKEEKKLKQTLQEALSFAKQNNITTIYNQYPQLFKEVLNKAIKLNIQKDYVENLLNFHFKKEEEKSYKIRIQTFGTFKVFVDNKEITDWKGAKPLYLLKTLVALKGENIPVGKIISIMWDGYDYIKAKQNLEFTLRKLRKILNDKNKTLIIQKNNRIYLNKDKIWIDIWEFEALYSELEFAINRNIKKNNHNEKLEKLKNLYKGRFLEFEDDIWIEQIRNDIDQKFRKLLKFEKNF